MKKIFIILFFVLLPVFVSAKETVNVKLEYVPNVYWNYTRNNILYWGQFAYIYADDKIAYCMDIETPVISSVYTKTDKVLSGEVIYGFVYFGYGYDGNNTLKDYMATQKILWYYTDSVDVYFTTQSNGKGTKIDISENEKSNRFRFEKYAVFPEYKKLQFVVGTNNSVENINDYTKEYTILNSSKNDISFDLNNNLIFNANEIGKSEFYLETKYKYNYDNIFYVADNSQEILIVGNMKNIKRTFFYEVIGGSININVTFDKDKNENICDNKFELYNSNNELIGIYSPDKEGNITINDLMIGKYKLKHVNITNGYDVDKTEYIFDITESNFNLEQNIILSVKKTKLVIDKTYSNVILNDLKYDSNITYIVYDDKDNYIAEIITDKNGYAEIELEYGNYKIVQSNVNNVNKYHNDIIISENMFDTVINHLIHDVIYKSNFKIHILDKNTNEVLGNVNFRINEKEYITNDNGICVIRNVDFGDYIFDDIDFSGYNKYSSFIYEINEDSDFYVENNELYTDLNIYLEKIIIEDFLKEEVPNNNGSNEIFINNNLNVNNDTVNENIDGITDTEINESNSINSIEKLPFLGDKNDDNKNSKIICYIYNFIKFNWM